LNKELVIRIIFWGKPKGVPKWPNIHFDPSHRIVIIKDFLINNFPEIKFVGWNWVKNEEDLSYIIEKIGSEKEEVVVIFHLSSGWVSAGKIMEKIPTVVISDPLLWGYAGMVTHSQNLRKDGVRGFIVSSKDWNDVKKAFKVIKAYHALRNSRIIVVGRHILGSTKEEYVKTMESLGVEILFLDFDELKNEYDGINEENVKILVNELIQKADKVIDVNRETLVKSIRMYYALKRLVEKYGANGITIDCLGGFYSGKLDAYPCIAFSLFDDEGKVMSACECDIDSLLTKIAMREIAGRPGFISEPAIDTSDNVAIYAHCVSATKLYGYDRENEPFLIRTHAEDDKGASIQVLSMYNGPGTIVKLIPIEKRILLLQGLIQGHMERELACRTKIVVEVKDGQALIDEWQHNWHRVLYYGDWYREIFWLSKLLGFSLVKEKGSY